MHIGKNIGLSIKPAEKNKNWREKKNERRNLKASAIKTDTKSGEADYSKTVFSDLIFKVTSDPYQVQSHSDSATSVIPEDPTIEGIFAAAYARMQVPVTTPTSNTDTVTLVIHKSLVDMLAKKGANIVDQSGN